MPSYVLVLNPDTTELRRLREMLSREGYSIMTATDTETAQHICRQIPVAMVLGDARMLGFGPGKPVSSNDPV
jgi:PleD family two-component response regulator